MVQLCLAIYSPAWLIVYAGCVQYPIVIQCSAMYGVVTLRQEVQRAEVLPASVYNVTCMETMDGAMSVCHSVTKTAVLKPLTSVCDVSETRPTSIRPKQTPPNNISLVSCALISKKWCGDGNFSFFFLYSGTNHGSWNIFLAFNNVAITNYKTE